MPWQMEHSPHVGTFNKLYCACLQSHTRTKTRKPENSKYYNPVSMGCKILLFPECDNTTNFLVAVLKSVVLRLRVKENCQLRSNI